MWEVYSLFLNCMCKLVVERDNLKYFFKININFEVEFGCFFEFGNVYEVW